MGGGGRRGAERRRKCIYMPTVLQKLLGLPKPHLQEVHAEKKKREMQNGHMRTPTLNPSPGDAALSEQPVAGHRPKQKVGAAKVITKNRN